MEHVLRNPSSVDDSPALSLAFNLLSLLMHFLVYYLHHAAFIERAERSEMFIFFIYL